MIQVRVRAFNLADMPRCEHRRVSCVQCGLDPFEAPPSNDHPEDHTLQSMAERPRFGSGVDHHAAEQ
jgi:hypothetical protein